MSTIIPNPDKNSQTQPLVLTHKWQIELKNAVSNVEELLYLLNLDKSKLSVSYQNDFPMRVPLSFIERMEKQNPQCPLLLQVLPVQSEHIDSQDFTSDPLMEKAFNPLPGLLHKFKSRVLLTLTKACAVHCRYCFRQNFAYEDNQISEKNLNDIITYIESDTSIKEVVLSGGDPLSLKDSHLKKILNRLEAIPHLLLIRFHTRFLVMIPSRITKDFISILSQSKKQLVIVLHINHPNEIDNTLSKALETLPSKVTLLNQSVLLKGINDQVETLSELSYKLIANRVQPYYLHQLDRVKGSMHFECPLPRAREIMKTLKDSLPGYLVPKFVQEVPGTQSKQLIEYESVLS